MYTNERVQNSDEAAARAAAGAHDGALGLRVPASLRAIFQVWAQACDPAPTLPRGGDARALVATYELLGAPALAAPLERRMLAQLYVNAALNRDYALWSELRQEAAAVLRWLVPIVGADPVLHALIAQAWPPGAA